jgi:hypothetical protein
MVFDMCSDFSKKMEGMVQGIASMDDAEASTVAGSRKRLRAREQALPNQLDETLDDDDSDDDESDDDDSEYAEENEGDDDDDSDYAEENEGDKHTTLHGNAGNTLADGGGGGEDNHGREGEEEDADGGTNVMHIGDSTKPQEDVGGQNKNNGEVNAGNSESHGVVGGGDECDREGEEVVGDGSGREEENIRGGGSNQYDPHGRTDDIEQHEATGGQILMIV